MSGKTGGRRAYDAWWATAEGVPRHPDVTYDQDADAWEAAAQAAIEAAPPAIIKFDGKLSEADVAELREKFAEAVRTERPRVLAEPGSERVAELVTEVNELRRLVDEILTARRVADALGIERVATLRAKAGLQTEPAVAFAGTEPVCPRCGTASCLEDASFGAAVVTAGTEHLVPLIRDLAIPDEL